MALRAGYQGFKKLLPGLKLFRPGCLGIDNAELSKTFFPRSEQAVLGAKNRFYVRLDNMSIFGDVSNGYNVAETVGAYTFLAKIKNGEKLTISKANIGNRFRICVFKDYPPALPTPNSAEIIWDNNLTEYSFSINGDYSYLAFTVDNGASSINPDIVDAMCRLASDSDPTYAPYAMTNKELTDKVTPIDIKSSVTMTEQSHYTIDGATNISRNGIMGIINGVISSADVEEQPVGHGWTTVMTGLPKAFKASATMVPASNPAKNPLNINITTNGELNMRGGSVGEYYYFNLSYLIDTTDTAANRSLPEATREAAPEDVTPEEKSVKKTTRKKSTAKADTEKEGE